MAVTLAISPTAPKALTTVTLTWAGLTATTAYVTSISNPQGHAGTIAGTSDGSGGLVQKFVPQINGLHTVNIALAVNPNLVITGSNTFQSGGHN